MSIRGEGGEGHLHDAGAGSPRLITAVLSPTPLKRKKLKPEGEEIVSWRPEVVEVDPPPVSKELKKRWSYFIRKVYETDPLTCPKCQGEMRIISFIDRPEVIKKILPVCVRTRTGRQHLGLR